MSSVYGQIEATPIVDILPLFGRVFSELFGDELQNGGRGMMSSLAFFIDPEQEVLEKQNEHLRRISGHDESTFQEIENGFLALEDPPFSLKNSYSCALRRKWDYLFFLEATLWERLCHHRFFFSRDCRRYDEDHIDMFLTVVRSTLYQDANILLQAIRFGERPFIESTQTSLRIFGETIDDMYYALSVDHVDAADRYMTLVADRFKNVSQDIRAVTVKRNEIYQKLLALFTTY
ncbi:MAG: hypothetical protein Q7R79_03565 [bacterium]|nr:hypothetical protein [bacterium]